MPIDQPTLIARLKKKFAAISPYLNEHARRIWVANEAHTIGKDGPVLVAKATGVALSTIYLGLKELHEISLTSSSFIQEVQHIRKPGGGRKKIVDLDPDILKTLESLVDSTTCGDPESPLKWTCKSTTKLCEELKNFGYRVSQRTVYALLKQLGYSLQANKKTREGKSAPDRNAQFIHISEMVKNFQRRGLPVISVDTKKKELVGDFKNSGREWSPKGRPEEVRVYDFPDKLLGKAIPYGIYDISANKGWVSVGFDHDTAEFAVESIRRWWHEMGRSLYPQACELLITADGGGSNGRRVKLWKLELQKLADELAINIHVCHFPPGTSKWNKIEHCMFCHISNNWRGKPLTSREVIVNLISSTKTREGLEVKARLDEGKYPKGKKVSKMTIDGLSIKKCAFHGEWNYNFTPRIET